MRRFRLTTCLVVVLLICGLATGPALAKRDGVSRLNVVKITNFNKPKKIEKAEKTERKTEKTERKTVQKPQQAAMPPLPEIAPKQRLTTPEPVIETPAYRPETLERLVLAKSLGGEAPSEAISAAIYASLTNRDAVIRVTAAERKAIAAHYSASGFKPLWIDSSGVDARGRELVAAFAAAAADGMEPADYLPPAMGSFADSPQLNRNDPVHLAEIELGLTAMALKYARHASGGRLIPNRLTSYNDISPERVEPARALKVLALTPFPANYLQGLEPRYPAFATLRKALADLRADMGGASAAVIPSGPTVKAGQSDERIASVRARLERLGLLEAGAALPVEPARFDDPLAKALTAFQTRMGLKPSGRLDALTLRALNKHDGKGDERRLIANMERLRWLPKDLGRRHVFVNQAAFELEVVEDNRDVWRTKVVIGRTETQTMSFHDRMETVVFNPSWGVPESIVLDEMLPLLRRDPTYLDRKGFRVVNRSGKVVKSASIDWAAFGDRPPYSVQQPPSEDNALGDIKFLFPNRHSIYMHDTPSRQLFQRPVRAFSHGCVRVENPRDFAAVLLGQDRAGIDAAIESGRSRSVKIADDIKVHITYFTAWPDGNGKVAYYGDIYGRDAGIERAFGTIAVAAK